MYVPSAANLTAHLVDGDIDGVVPSSGRLLTMDLACAKLVVRIYRSLSYFLSNIGADVPSCLAVAGESLERQRREARLDLNSASAMNRR